LYHWLYGAQGSMIFDHPYNRGDVRQGHANRLDF